jgi:DNA-binding protein Fis
MSRLKDLTGMKFCHLLVIKRVGSDGHKEARWLCLCDCGNETIVSAGHLKSGDTKSCGCLRDKKSAERYFQDLTGQRIGHLTVLGRSGYSKDDRIMWECKCDCGKTVKRKGKGLKRGNLETKSCGCCSLDTLPSENTVRAKHMGTNSRLFRIWKGMRDRCHCEKWEGYKRYGGRGITVCNEWNESYVNFRDWALSNGYASNLTIERKDVNGNYCPENCTWATWKEQANNRRGSLFATYNGETKSIPDWARLFGINNVTLRNRLKRGLSMEEAIGKSAKNAKEV